MQSSFTVATMLRPALLVASVLLTVTTGLHHVPSMDPVRYSLHHSGWLQQRQHLEQPQGDSADAPMVTIPVLGSARGRVAQSYFGRNYSQFMGIPYVTKTDRFEYSVMNNDTAWSEEGVYDATYFRDRCPQHSMIGPFIVGDEDCLHINIFTPLMDFATSEKKLPVMLFIHGGGFMTGDATLYLPTKLMDKDVLVATIQYRLGTLGFLYSGTSLAPGNMGLMDQINAVRWVHEFISYFGGDPGSVTVFGQSAGGASTSWLMISPLIAEAEEQLVHQFIPMSGSALEYWALEHDWQNSFEKQAAAVNCTDGHEGNYNGMVKCMKRLSFEKVVQGSISVYHEDQYNGGLGFLGQIPVVQSALDSDAASDGLERVIVEHPLQSLTHDRFLHVPLMTGSVRDEGTLVMGLLYEGFMRPRDLNTQNTTFLRDYLLPMTARAFGLDDVTNSVSNAFRLGFLPVDVNMGNWNEMIGGLVDMTGMMFLKSGLWTVAQLVANSTSPPPVYFYSFEYDSDDSLFPWIFFGDPEIPIESGICHADDLLYLFDLPAMFDDDQKDMVRQMTTLYTNFATYGNPTPDVVKKESEQWESFAPKWEPFNFEDRPLLIIDSPSVLGSDYVTRWNYNKYGFPLANETKTVERAKASAAAAVAAAQGEGSSNSSSGASGMQLTAILAAVAMVCLLAVVIAAAALHRRSNAVETSRQATGHDNLAMTDLY